MVIAIFILFQSRNWLKQGNHRRNGRYVIACILIVCESSLNVWYITEGTYRLRSTLPLELCSISLYLCVLMLFTKSRTIFQIVYFTGLGGALQALLTPALAYAYPNYRFMEFFIAHIAIILAVLYMVWVEGYRPKLFSVALAMIFLNVLLVVVGFMNRITGGNYMFIARKPETASLLDVLGPYPWYLLSLEGVALLMFLLLYLPFSFGNRRAASGTLQR
ncbi:YwaF family protein [Paenibacillus swuensis]